MPPTNHETELKFHVGYLPDVDSFISSLSALGWDLAAASTRTQHDTYVADEAGVLATLRAALRWRVRDDDFIVAIKQEQESTGAHFSRFELEAPTHAPTSMEESFLTAVIDAEIPAPIRAWLQEHDIAGPFAPLAWLSTTRTAITGTGAGVTAEFALDSVTARKPGRKHAFTFYEIECEYNGSLNAPLLQHTERYLATLPGARPSPTSKLDFSLRLL